MGAGAPHGHLAVGVFFDDVRALRCSGPGAADLDRTLPWLRAEARERLFTELRELDPFHAWLERA